MPFRTPRDPGAPERRKAVQRALRAQRKAAAKANTRAEELKKAAQEQRRVAYEKARERNRAALAEAKKRQRAALKKAKERLRELAAAREEQRASKTRSAHDAAVLRRFVRPATGPAIDVVAALTRRPRPPGPKHAPQSHSARPVQLAFGNMNAKGRKAP